MPKISALPEATVSTGADIAVVQGGVSKKMPVALISSGAAAWEAPGTQPFTMADDAEITLTHSAITNEMYEILVRRNTGQTGLTNIDLDFDVGDAGNFSYSATNIEFADGQVGLKGTSTVTFPTANLALSLNDTLTDSSASPATMTSSGISYSTDVPTGYSGKSLSVDTTADLYVDASPRARSDIGGSAWTICFWHKFTANGATIRNILDSRATNGSDPWVLYDKADTSLWIWDGTSETEIGNAGLFSTGWHHYAIVRDGTSLKVYKDGTLHKSNTVSGSTWPPNGTNTVTRLFTNVAKAQPFTGLTRDFVIAASALWSADFTPPKYTGTRTNLHPYSQDLTQAVWTMTGLGTPVLVSGAPDLTSTANRLTCTAGAGSHYALGAVVCSTGKYTVSAYFKAGTNRYMVLGDRGDAAYHNATIDMNDGSIAHSTGVDSATSTLIGDGWYRVKIVFDRTNASFITPMIAFSDQATNVGTPSFTAAGTETADVWGLQVEAGDQMSAYIPTLATAVTVGNTQYATGWASGDRSSVRTTDASQFSLASVSRINSITVTKTETVDHELRWAVSFDDRATWVTWNGASWEEVDITVADKTGWAATADLEDAFTNWTPTTETTIDFAAAFKTTDINSTPKVSLVSINYDASTRYDPCTVGSFTSTAEFGVQRQTPTTTKIKNLSGAEQQVFVHFIIP